jgi:hypothetical protein
MNINVNINPGKVEVPMEVYTAFENLKRAWRNLLPPEDLDFILLNIQEVGQYGDGLILKRYARDNPKKYVKALANGYIPEAGVRVAADVKKFLSQWLEDHGATDDPEAQQEIRQQSHSLYDGTFCKTKMNG